MPDAVKPMFDCLGGLHLLLNCNYTDYTLNLLKLRNVPHFYIEILHAWYLINKYTSAECPTQKHVDENILWYNQDIVFEKKMLFYEDWYKSGIIYLNDIFKDGTFVSVNELFIRLNTRRSKQFFIFDYTKLQKSIPKIWINDKHRVLFVFKDHNLSIPHFVFGKSVKPVSLLSSKQWYNMISFEQIKINKCCLYWEDVLQKDVKWSSVFDRNLIGIKDFRLREFNFKLLYNMLPVRNNLFKWGLAYDNLCLKCKKSEDVLHAFISCKANERFFKYLKDLVLRAFNLRIEIDIVLLLKMNSQTEIDLIMTIAFWSIYKMIIFS